MYRLSLLIGLLVLAGCGLAPEDTPFTSQSVTSCSYNGQAYKQGYVAGGTIVANYPATDISAKCNVYRDGYDTYKAVVSLQRSNNLNTWDTVRVGESRTTTVSNFSSTTISFDHMKAIGPDKCGTGSVGYYHRGRIVITWRNDAGTVRGSTNFYTPYKHLPGCV